MWQWFIVSHEHQQMHCHNHNLSFRTMNIAFSALTLLVGRQEEHRPVKNWVVGCWRGCLGWGADLHIPQQMPLPLTISCSSKSRLVLTFLVLPFWYLLIRVVPDKFQKSSKTVVCVCVCVRTMNIASSCWFLPFGALKGITVRLAIYCYKILFTPCLKKVFRATTNDNYTLVFHFHLFLVQTLLSKYDIEGLYFPRCVLTTRTFPSETYSLKFYILPMLGS